MRDLIYIVGVVNGFLLCQDDIWVFVDDKGCEPRSTGGGKPTNGYVVDAVNHFRGDMLWHSMKPKIKDWVDFQALEFAREESEASRLNPIEWLEWYIYIDIPKIFFCEFHVLLYEWLFRLATQQRNFQKGEPIQ